MQANQSNPSQGTGPNFRTPQLRTQSPPHRTLAEAPGCLWSAFTSPQSPSTLEPRNSFNPTNPVNPLNLINLLNLLNPPRLPASDHMRPYPTISDLQHVCPVPGLVPNPKSKIKNSRSAHPTICDHMRPYPTFSIPARSKVSGSRKAR